MAAEGFQADASQIRRHAGTVDAVRARLAAVKAASAHIAQDDGAYGLLCSWLPAVLEGRHQEQDSLVAYAERNLSQAADSLVAAAGDYDDTDATAADAVRKAGDRLGR
ncbi:hypothetical protein Ahu01nite_055270 [Winogradskya humida]|uniref:Excreted virulence factor EspC (Type VII ESX diderm) n=1 Tax=Winogradskya humida TaxID=113566 RepID=A0ABQ3ZV07_9ACTN|nr:hypothetical protein Ahu01nite_055270 [Actinoplanes humidus]